MDINDRTAIIAIRRQRAEVGGLQEISVNPEMNNSGHPFGPVLLRLKLALALAIIYASGRQAHPAPAHARTRS